MNLYKIIEDQTLPSWVKVTLMQMIDKSGKQEKLDAIYKVAEMLGIDVDRDVVINVYRDPYIIKYFKVDRIICEALDHYVSEDEECVIRVEMRVIGSREPLEEVVRGDHVVKYYSVDGHVVEVTVKPVELNKDP